MTRRGCLLTFALLLALFAAGSPSFAQTSTDIKPGSKSAAKKSLQVDINSASKENLTALPGVGEFYSQKIIDGRPYKRKHDLVTRKIIPEETYDQIKDQIIARKKK